MNGSHIEAMEQVATQSEFERIAERERRYLLPTYLRYPLAIARGKGVFVYDVAGRRYLDFVGGLGVNALGHAHPRILKALREQAGRAIHVSNLYYHEFQGALAEKLCALSGLGRAFFTNSGTEAIEGALKLARAAGQGESKSGIVALDGSFHGRTYGAISMTGQARHREGFAPLVPGVSFVKLNDVAGLEAAVSEATCAIVLEPIQGEGGIVECSGEFLRAARAAADRHRAVLIFDEIQCGLGRTGEMFAFQATGVRPDVLTLAKPLAAGLPLGAFLVKEELAGAIRPGGHGTTFGGGPLACRVALEYLAVLEDERLLENVQRVGAHLKAALEGMVERYPERVRQARGRGFMQALELRMAARPLAEEAMAEGVLFNATQDVVLRVLPPFPMTEKHVDRGMRLLHKLLRKRRKKDDMGGKEGSR